MHTIPYIGDKEKYFKLFSVILVGFDGGRPLLSTKAKLTYPSPCLDVDHASKEAMIWWKTREAHFSFVGLEEGRFGRSLSSCGFFVWRLVHPSSSFSSVKSRVSVVALTVVFWLVQLQLTSDLGKIERSTPDDKLPVRFLVMAAPMVVVSCSDARG
eukprot:Gb_06215 [translate_table: standard]